MSSHTREICTCLHTRWWMENHVLNTGRITPKNKTSNAVVPSKRCMHNPTFSHTELLWEMASVTSAYTTFTQLYWVSLGKRLIFNSGAFVKWLSARVREGMTLRQIYSGWKTVTVAVVKGWWPMWPIHVSLRVGCIYPILTTALKMFNIAEAIISRIAVHQIIPSSHTRNLTF